VAAKGSIACCIARAQAVARIGAGVDAPCSSNQQVIASPAKPITLP
jgi:hypothetical protein